MWVNCETKLQLYPFHFTTAKIAILALSPYLTQKLGFHALLTKPVKATYGFLLTFRIFN